MASRRPFLTFAGIAGVAGYAAWRAWPLKWIPAAQGIDPSEPRCDADDGTLARLGLPLPPHAGTERGVRVVMAHCATMGEGRDLDVGSHRPWVDNFALFERMKDARFETRPFFFTEARA